jgi:hypothetical protein
MRIPAIVFAAVFVVGCSSSYHSMTLVTPTAKLERGRSVLVAMPKNGSYANREYTSSGQQTANAIRAVFAKYSNAVTISPSCAAVECLRSQGADSYDYLVIPEILQWEDRATEWSGLPDRIEIKLVVIDSRSEKELSSSTVSGVSKWATLGGDHPQDLLPGAVGTYVETLY